MRLLLLVLALFAALTPATGAERISVGTIERPPFVMVTDEGLTGFSIELWNAISEDLGLETHYRLTTTFPEMLAQVEDGKFDAAIANITITLAREERIDFSQPIFDSGLQILVPDHGKVSILSALLTWEMARWVVLGLALLFAIATLMWFFERRRQPYFSGSYGESIWPSFWWALNTVVNGGFEERVPRSWPGRIFGVILVVTSLFAVSLFVAKITTTMTVGALQSDIQSIDDLYGKRVGTTRGSTTAIYLEKRRLKHREFDGIEPMFKALEDGELDAIVHDSPILSYFAATEGRGLVRTTGHIFHPEKYGIALKQGSPRTESINRALLKLRENGTYQNLIDKWFGMDYQ